MVAAATCREAYFCIHAARNKSAGRQPCRTGATFQSQACHSREKGRGMAEYVRVCSMFEWKHAFLSHRSSFIVRRRGYLPLIVADFN